MKDLPKSNPYWHGHTDGSLWMCGLADDTSPVVVFWIPPGGAPAAEIDPGALAKHALAVMPLRTAYVQIAPANPDPTYVGVQNWLWLPKPQWATLRKTVSVGGTSVSVTARPTKVLWDMGPQVRTCEGPGRAWHDGMSDAAQTTCSYAYSVTSDGQPGRMFHVTARIGYQVDWTCRGRCARREGTLGVIEAPAGSGRLRVLQRQTVLVQ
ncbi:hypothetical protein [Nocardioides terrisoli]|uniref:hypothetical protein n=1 Tax=Nocardioides terrisoli TaxID=3388267 RepID=UPI00287B743B|nr:hypothetical protein [Nocardioides marmorisolisilvae]